MENKFLAKIFNYISTVFEKIAVIRTRQALISLDDSTLAEIGYTRQQVLNGDFNNEIEVVNLSANKLGVKKSFEEKKAA